ncbi:trehalose/maltose transport system substrate-binding protein [Deinobacterium chartae]|uniref:Trehalose/maltose transport system substrate-binding protein n=1 Tax=Deinobacterium chartae TaxID=521158 RepID=A0A841HXD1_9DEIO|nr:ABC transporter substrate-binding protein [Deinobacterium chartae]MBB6096899.1 trehalose/maltose transport system substrate-binding protein [Deinobacterium chartae]
MKALKALGILTVTALIGQAAAVQVSISCGAVGAELEFCKKAADEWAKKTGNTVRIVQTPNDTNDRLALYQQNLSAKSSDIDVYQLDVIWPGLLGQHFVDLKGKIPQSEINAHFEAIIKNNTVNGKLIAMPWFTDAGLLYYRKDLLEKYGYKNPPTTWAQLSQMATKIQAGERKNNRNFQGYVFQGKSYEGLTCNALEWIYSYGGGTIVDSSGKVTINNPRAVQALKDAASWIGKTAPRGVTTYAEEEARGLFQAGNAAFMRNWPYAWGLAQGDDSKIKDKIGVAPLPKGSGAQGRHAATLGGWQLGVSIYSKNQKEAIDLVRYLTSAAVQKDRAINGSYNPTIKALYRDKDVTTAVPFMGDLYDVFTSAVARPSGPTKGKYNQVSSAFYGAVYNVLSGRSQPEAALKSLETNLNRIKGRGW